MTYVCVCVYVYIYIHINYSVYFIYILYIYIYIICIYLICIYLMCVYIYHMYIYLICIYHIHTYVLYIVNNSVWCGHRVWGFKHFGEIWGWNRSTDSKLWSSVDFGSGSHHVSRCFWEGCMNFDMSLANSQIPTAFLRPAQEVKTLRFCKLCKEQEVPNWHMLELRRLDK
jgi:hypothetical protein